MRTLDLIVTHYNEPWDVGKKFFDQLALQRGINFSSMRVIIIQDGPDGALNWRSCLDGYPFDFKIKTIPHGGVSRARNAGIELSDAEWIIFCDFDDTFTSIHSIHKFYDNIEDGIDLISAYVYGEQPSTDGVYTLETYVDNDIFIHGKMFRRDFLIINDIRFEPDVTFSEDTLFCNVAKISLGYGRKREIPEALFTHCWRTGSVCRDYENNFSNAVGIFRSRKALVREYLRHGLWQNYTGTVCKTVFDYYYAITSGGYPHPDYFEKDFMEFWNQYGTTFNDADRDLIAYENDLAFHEAVHKGFQVVPDITFHTWLRQMKDKYREEEKTSAG